MVCLNRWHSYYVSPLLWMMVCLNRWHSYCVSPLLWMMVCLNRWHSYCVSPLLWVMVCLNRWHSYYVSPLLWMMVCLNRWHSHYAPYISIEIIAIFSMFWKYYYETIFLCVVGRSVSTLWHYIVTALLLTMLKALAWIHMNTVETTFQNQTLSWMLSDQRQSLCRNHWSKHFNTIHHLFSVILYIIMKPTEELWWICMYDNSGNKNSVSISSTEEWIWGSVSNWTTYKVTELHCACPTAITIMAVCFQKP